MYLFFQLVIDKDKTLYFIRMICICHVTLLSIAISTAAREGKSQLIVGPVVDVVIPIADMWPSWQLVERETISLLYSIH